MNNACETAFNSALHRELSDSFYPFAHKVLQHTRATGQVEARRPCPGAGFCGGHSGSCWSAEGGSRMGEASPQAQLERQPTRAAWLSAGASPHPGCEWSLWRGLCLPGGGGGWQGGWEAGAGQPPGHLPPALLQPRGVPAGFPAPKSALTPSGHCPRLQEPSHLSCLTAEARVLFSVQLPKSGGTVTCSRSRRAGRWVDVA